MHTTACRLGRSRQVIAVGPFSAYFSAPYFQTGDSAVKWGDVFRRKYLSAKDIPMTGITGVVSRIEMEDVGGEGRPNDYKPVLYLDSMEQGVTVNHTRHAVLETAWGEDSDNCIGKELKLSRGRTIHMSKPVDCIVFYAVSPPSEQENSNVVIVN